MGFDSKQDGLLVGIANKAISGRKATALVSTGWLFE